MKMKMKMMKPAWLEGLISVCFFGECGIHAGRRKNEMNVFCLHCCLTICPHCLPSHPSPSHPLLQIRRYVYHDVVRLGDLDNLIDCCYIQPYTINGAKVIFLNHRPQSRPSKPASSPSNVCLTCHRILQQPFHFCSLSCKVDHMVFQGADFSSTIFNHHSDFALQPFQLDNNASDHDDHHPQIPPPNFPLSYEATSNNSSREPEIEIEIDKNKKNKKKTNTNGFLPGIVLSRRKGAPQRAPLS